ncbi:glutamine--tRNA ligase [Cephaloticoccus primus]|uniref:Glutamine--tRNA ligase n=1 Tax=Cephaloticoccus primus TaxID=1548207 RepID=A0A139SMJ5_9BACT|nr:glutamine--tRNA ligase [Cephaloticoccus primus]KXU35797.1 glutamine--tRNA ligase [Cephaloticoccus primus]
MPDNAAVTAAAASATPTDFIRDIVATHVAEGRYPQIVTRFPPEPNGYLHLGHARAICLSFGVAREQGGRCHLRFDDTNPAKEDSHYVEAITRDIRWLISGWADAQLTFKPRGAQPETRTGDDGRSDRLVPHCPADSPDAEPYAASDYFEALYDYAVELIRRGKAYVCDLSPEDTERYRGTPTQPGQNSPWRERSVAENLDLFARMRAGEFPDGARTLRAKIDMASPNLWLRDPLLYRIRHIAHHRTGDQWCIYPLYDYAHCLSDYLEGITHSFCSLEFVVHRPLYDWVLDSLELPRPRPHQYEFAKLIPSYTIMSKRNLLRLVQERAVEGWDDPRMPTLAGLRRRGVPAQALRRFVIGTGITTHDGGLTDIALFEHTLRDELNKSALRRLAVLRPLKLVLTNLAEGEAIPCAATNDPQSSEPTTRIVNLTREVFIERDDFAEVPPPKFHRLKPGGEVRLKYACIIQLDEIVKDAAGNLVELRATAQLDTRAGQPNSNKKVKGTIHWVSASESIEAQVRLYDRLFTVPEPAAEDDFLKVLNPHSLEIVNGARLEPSLAAARPGEPVQFERLGYFVLDAQADANALASTREGEATLASASSPSAQNAAEKLKAQVTTRPVPLIFNRTITLRDNR